MEIVILLIAGLIAPPYVTVRNLLRVFRFKTSYRLLDDIIVFALGIPLTMFSVPSTPWYEPIIVGNDAAHAPVLFNLTFAIILLIAFASYVALRVAREKLPPIPRTLALAGMYVGCIYSVLWIVQLSKNLIITDESPIGTEALWGVVLGNVVFMVFMAMLFAFNYILLTVRIVIEYVKAPPAEFPAHKNPLLHRISLFLSRCGTFPVAAFVALFPLCLLLLAVLALFGQQPQVLMSCFTDTSDWFFSTRVSPPPIEPSGGHYLCTVAARGDRKLVKPLRPGMRHGSPIIVNRQLCVANAFEELLAERLPRFHHFVRRNYDKYGLPICRYIDKPWKADVIYLCMKPAEWLFALTLYTFDIEPEKRIARQYSSNS